MRKAPAEVAAAIERRVSRRLARVGARLLTHVARLDGDPRVPPRLATRLRGQISKRAPQEAFFPAPPIDASRRQYLLVSHDLSRSGAPQLVVEMAKMLIAAGAGVTVLTPVDGPQRPALVQAGATVLVSEAARHPGSLLLTSLAEVVDAAICNTIVTTAAVETLAPRIPLIWYVHEVSLLEQQLAEGDALARRLALPARVWAGSELPASLIRPHRPDVEITLYGLDPIATGEERTVGADRPLRLAVFGSFEARKGQDLLLDAFELLAPEQRRTLRLKMYGRILLPDFHATLSARAAAFPEVTLGADLDLEGYRRAMRACDAVVVPSRDDTLPLVSLDALGCGRLLICTRTTGTSAYLDSGHNGFVAPAPTARDLADTLIQALACADDWRAIAQEGHTVFAANFSKAVFAQRLGAELAAITSHDEAAP